MTTPARSPVFTPVGSILESESSLSSVHPCTLAFVAGLFDSGGMITVFRSKGATFRLRVSIFHYHLRLIQWARDALGVGSIVHPTKRRGHELRMRTSENGCFLREVSRFVVLRRSHVEAGLAYLRGYEPCRGAERPTSEQINHRLKFQQLLGALNGELARNAWQNGTPPLPDSPAT